MDTIIMLMSILCFSTNLGMLMADMDININDNVLLSYIGAVVVKAFFFIGVITPIFYWILKVI